MAKKQLPQPKRSLFDQTELLQRIADLEHRVEMLETRNLLNGNYPIGANCGPL